jgi:Mg-chelatase subunit ChlD
MPDHDALEVQVTALLLGELSAADAASLRARIEADPALRTLHDRLRIAIELTRAATRPPQAKELPRPDAPRLDPARRDQLLAKLRTPAAPPQPDIIPLPTAAPSAGSASRRTSNRREWLAMAAMLVVLLATAAGVQLFRRESRELYANAAVDGRANTGWFESRAKAAEQVSEEHLGLARHTIQLWDGAVPPPSKPAGPTPPAPPSPTPATRADPAPRGELRSYQFAPATAAPEADDAIARSKTKDNQLDASREKGIKGINLAFRDAKRLSTVEDQPVAAAPADSTAIEFTATSPAGGTPTGGDRSIVGAQFDKASAGDRRGVQVANGTVDNLEALYAGNGRDAARPQVLQEGSDAKKEQPPELYAGFTAGGAGGFGGGGGLGGTGGSPGFGGVVSGQPADPGSKAGASQHWEFRSGPAEPASQPEPIPRAVRLEEMARKSERGSNSEDETRFSKNLVAANGPAQPPEANAPIQPGLGFGEASPPVELRDTDDFGVVAPARKFAKLPALGESRAKNDLAQDRELEEVQLAQRVESIDQSTVLKSSIDALDFSGMEAKQHDINGDVASRKPHDAARDKTLGGLVVQESAGRKLSLLAAKTKADADADGDQPVQPPTPPAPVPQPEVQTAADPFSTFSLNVSDVSFQLAAASLDQGALPAPGSIRTEEFINAFNYRDPMPVGTAPVAFAWERSRDAFAHNRDLLRFSIKTAATGREATKPLNIVLLVDNSGSMERADRVRIRHECLRILATQLQPQDRISVVTFARTARLAADGIPGNQAGALADQIGSLTPEGGTHLEGALDLAYQTARRHFSPTGINRVVLLTDGAANLGDVSPDSLRRRVEDNRRQGVALDCFGIGWEGLNDDLLENLSRNGDGRYGFINTLEVATSNFATQLAGALQVAASDVKVQVEFNPLRVTTHRQVGYARHQLKKEQFRDNTVDAAELAAAEAGNALYVVQSNPAGSGPIATVRVRFKVPGTADYREMSWEVPYEGSARALDQSSPALRLAAVASNFAEWLAQSPHAAEVTPDRLLPLLNGIPQSQPGDPRPARLESMIRQARSLGGR